MKLDFDIARDILLYLEEHLEYSYNGEYIECDCLSSGTIAKALNLNPEDAVYTLEKLSEANFIEISVESHDLGTVSCDVSTITFSGHEYLNSVRSSKIWKGVKTVAADVGAATFETIKFIATEYLHTLIRKTLSNGNL